MYNAGDGVKTAQPELRWLYPRYSGVNRKATIAAAFGMMAGIRTDGGYRATAPKHTLKRLVRFSADPTFWRSPCRRLQFDGLDDGAVHAVGDLLGETDRRIGEAGGGEAVEVLLV